MRRLLERSAIALHGLIVRGAPAETQRTYRAQMRDTFRQQCAAAPHAGVVMSLLLRELTDIVRARRAGAPASVAMSWRLPPGLWRGLRRRPGYVLAVMLTLALGTAGTTTMFALVDTIILSPLPYPDGDRLVTVLEASPDAPGRGTLMAPGRIEEWHERNAVFTAIAGSYAENVTDTSSADPERLDARRVTPRFFDVFAMPPLIGRVFTAEEEQLGGPGAAVVSEALWRRRYGGDSSVLGRTMTFSGKPYVIVGVMPRTFTSAPIDVWMPAQIHPQLMQARAARFVSGIGRMKAGVSIEQAKADLDRVQQHLGEQFPATDKGWTSVVADLKAARVGSGRMLWIIFAAVGTVWLIGIANVASLVIVQVQRRTKELAIRAALGSSRAQLIVLLGLEMLLLSMAGSVCGLVLTSWAVSIIPSVFDSLPRLNEFGLTSRALLFTVGSSVVAAIVCGVVPAWSATRAQGSADVTRAGRGTTTSMSRTQRGLVAAQVALGMVVCASAGLLASSYYQLTSQDRGFSADQVVTFHVGARWDEDRVRIGAMQIAVIDALSALPGVSAAGFVNFLPSPGGSLRYDVEVDGLSVGGQRSLPAGARLVGGRYFDALGVSVIAGSGCGPLHADMDRPRNALVNQSFVDRYAGGQSVIGRRLRIVSGAPMPYTISGVVPDLAEDGVQVARFPFAYACDHAGSWPDPNYVVRARDAALVTSQLRQIVRSIDASRAVFDVRMLDDVMNGAVAEPRQQAGLVAAFAATALLLTALGLYALLARHVSDSRREIGVRLALGATRANVIGVVARRAAVLVVSGLLVGTVLTGAAYQVLQTSLHGTAAINVAGLGGIMVVLVAVCATAVFVPARRAARVAPTDALRGE